MKYVISKVRKTFLLALCAGMPVLLGAQPVTGEPAASADSGIAVSTVVYRIPDRLERLADSSEIRRSVALPWVQDTAGAAALFQPEFRVDSSGRQFRIFASLLCDFITLTVSPVRDGVAADISRGSWVFYRSRTDGRLTHVRLFFGPETDIYVQLRAENPERPESGRSVVDLVIHGFYVRHSIPLGMPMTAAVQLSVQELINRTSRSIPWRYLDPDVSRYVESAEVSSLIRDRLHTLVYLDDGAFDEFGRPVFIATGELQDPRQFRSLAAPGQEPALIRGGVNCSGFAKWVIDGIIVPASGTHTRIPALKTATPSPDTHFNRQYRESRDIFFGLDWTRHLAAAAVSLRSGRTFFPQEAGTDVTVEPFALFSAGVPEGIPAAPFAGYSADVGYQPDYLRTLLYILAVDEPGTMYLAAVSHEGGNPPLRTWSHVAVFIPWFDRNGSFRVDVFESAAETPLERFIARTSVDGGFVHLSRVRLPLSGSFDP